MVEAAVELRESYDTGGRYEEEEDPEDIENPEPAREEDEESYVEGGRYELGG